MSREHAKVAKQIPASVLRCGPRHMLRHICEKCGSGEPFKTKNGKTVTLPAGTYQITDRELMKVLGTNRRQTIYENRQTMLAACRRAVTVTLEHKQGYRYPTNVYHVDLEKLRELIHVSENGVKPRIGKRYMEAQRKSRHGKPFPTTKTATHTGDASHLSGDAASARTPLAEGGVGGGEAANAAVTSQRSATLRCGGGDAADPPYTENLEIVKGLLDDLTQFGYEADASIETVNRIVVKLEAEQIEPVSLFRYIGKAQWILGKTSGRTDWLADRIESDSDRSLLAQFRKYLAGQQRRSADVPESDEASVEKAYLEGDIDMEDEITPKTLKECSVRCEPFKLYNGANVLPVVEAYQKTVPQLMRYTPNQLWGYHNRKKWAISPNRDELQASCEKEAPVLGSKKFEVEEV
jgi:hypothetical protein